MNEDTNKFYRDMFIKYALSFRSTSEDFVLISQYLFLRHSNCVKSQIEVGSVGLFILTTRQIGCDTNFI